METVIATRRAKVQNSILEKFFVEEIRDIYGAEKYMQKNLSKFKEAASSPKLKKAFEDHNRVTIEQISRLEDIFGILERRPSARKCEAMEGLIEEANNVVKDTPKNSAIRDVAMILAAQKAEHYEIATYGGLVQLANTLGYDKIADKLKETLGEEKETDELLTNIAQNNINYQAGAEKK